MLIGSLIGGVLCLIGLDLVMYGINPYFSAKEELIRKGEISQNQFVSKEKEKERELKINKLAEKYRKISKYGSFLVLGSIPLTIMLINVLE